MSKISVGESLTIEIKSGSKKVYGQEGRGVTIFSIEKSLSHSAENLRREPFTVALISGTEKVWRRGGGVPRFSVKQILSHSVESFRGGIPYCCIISGSEKVIGQKDEKEYQDVPSKFFCPTVPKFSVGNPYCCINFGYRKSLEKRGGGEEYQDFPSTTFCLTVPKISVGIPLLLH